MRLKKLVMVILAACFVTCTPQHVLNAQSTLNNNEVMKLVKAGLSDDLIISTINSQPGAYDTSTDGLIALKKAGVSDKVVGTIVTKGFAPAAQPAPAQIAASAPVAINPDDPAQVHSPGIYILAAGRDGRVHLTKLDHIVPKQAKTSGLFASAITYGAVKAHVKAVVDGSKATVQTPETNPIFYAYIPEDNSTFGGSSITVKDFAMVKFDVKGQQREINTASVSMWGASGGVDEKSRQGFTNEMVKPGIYKLALIKPLPLGEFAFQQSGAQGSSADQKNTGSYFDFGVIASQ